MRELSPLADKVYTVTPDNPRSLPAAELASVYRAEGADATPYGTVEEAVNVAMKEAEKTGKPLFILGSLYLYCQIYPLVEKYHGQV